jgi:hypothetical protein
LQSISGCKIFLAELTRVLPAGRIELIDDLVQALRLEPFGIASGLEPMRHFLQCLERILRRQLSEQLLRTFLIRHGMVGSFLSPSEYRHIPASALARAAQRQLASN